MRDPESVVRLNHLQFAGTHNSYHLAPFIAFDASHNYTHTPVREQAETWGVRAFEFDLHDGGDHVDVYHIQSIDPGTSCKTLDDCLTELRGWSDSHPKHLPIIVWLEAKDELITGPILNRLDMVDESVSRVLGDRAFTPDDLKGSYGSPRAALDAEGWPTLAAMRGKFVFAVLNNNAVTRSYSSDFTTLDGRMMFIKATPEQYDLPWAAVTKIDNPLQSDELRTALERRFLVGSNTCTAGISAQACGEQRAAAVNNGSTTLHDDFERDAQPFGQGVTAGCNPITAPPECALLDFSER